MLKSQWVLKLETQKLGAKSVVMQPKAIYSQIFETVEDYGHSDTVSYTFMILENEKITTEFSFIS